MRWRSCRLGDLFTLKRGHDLPSDLRHDGDVPVVSSSGITGHHNESKAKAPGVVTGRYGTIGEVFYLDEDYWPLNTALYVVDFKDTHPKFAAYFLKNVLRGYQSDKAAVPGVDRNVLHEVKVRVPDTKIQESIAEILSAYDDLIENNWRRMALLEESARLLYREWFVRLRFPGHEHTHIINGVPDGWERGNVSDFYDTASGGTPSRTNPDFFTGEILWVKTGELLNGFVADTEEKITEDALKKSAAKLFPERTLLVAMYGATIGQIGIIASPASSNQACCAIIPRKPKYSFIHAFLFFRENKDKLVGLSMGAAQNNINQQIIRSYPMVMPTSRLLESFNDSLKPVFDQLLNLHYQNHQLRAARDLLLPQLMSGEIPV
jgi:type I restriction enzyme S subunit